MHGNDQSGAGTPPVHEHFEHVDHPGGDPNNINMVTQDIVNDDRNGVHSNVVQHVAINGNNINGQHGVKVVNGANGVVINDQGNRATAPNGSVQVSGSDGPVVATH
ncbi:hypothetical protein LPJ61_000095 [Coemansia biformis]|uniref:Uncharacterized protein n=1 Tax=Coemansia biformis TaxID=1286918 RepID=A0A9W7YCG0_9FUNG|nr:hypothetical protein LPJ61_000095 [Coemansia biformis]